MGERLSISEEAPSSVLVGKFKRRVRQMIFLRVA